MHNSDATSILNCAFDNPCFFTWAIWKLFFKSKHGSLAESAYNAQANTRLNAQDNTCLTSIEGVPKPRQRDQRRAKRSRKGTPKSQKGTNKVPQNYSNGNQRTTKKEPKKPSKTALAEQDRNRKEKGRCVQHLLTHFLNKIR